MRPPSRQGVTRFASSVLDASHGFLSDSAGLRDWIGTAQPLGQSRTDMNHRREMELATAIQRIRHINRFHFSWLAPLASYVLPKMPRSLQSMRRPPFHQVDTALSGVHWEVCLHLDSVFFRISRIHRSSVIATPHGFLLRAAT